MSKFALLIGINYIGQEAELNGCINDIMITRDILISKFGYRSNNIVILSDKSNIKPTKNNILRNINNLVDKSNKGFNELWFHFSGHGVQVKDLNGDEKDKLDEAIVPLDYEKNGFIIDDTLANILKKINNNAKLFSIMDCCHSGTILDLPYKLNNNNNWIEENTLKLNNNICMISGCKDDQTSMDAFIPSSKDSILWRGAMTWSLIESLKKYNYSIKIIDLIKEMRKLLENSGYNQIPQLSSSKKMNINTYLDTFIKQKRITLTIKRINNRIRRRRYF
jgi:hypothetical protein